MEGYYVSDNTADMDVDVIHNYINRSYWAAGVPKNTQRKAIENSLCFGVFTAENTQIGFARVITDRATYAYLCDVFILEAYRGKGLSKWLMQQVVEHPDLQGLRRMTLATKDAHTLYQQFGFKSLANPDNFMEIWHPTIYQSNA